MLADKRRSAVVVEDAGLFAPGYPNVIMVPLTDDAALVIPDLAVRIDPAPENGCVKPCWAVAHLVASTSKGRLTGTKSRVTDAQLALIRRRVGLSMGLEG